MFTKLWKKLFKMKPLASFVVLYTNFSSTGSGCGSVGKAVASNTRGTWFESSHQRKFIYLLNICLLSTVYWKNENKEKEAGNGQFKKNLSSTWGNAAALNSINDDVGTYEFAKKTYIGI